MISKKWLYNYFKPRQKTVLGVSTDHDLHTENPTGRAVIWATAPVTWDTPLKWLAEGDICTLRGTVTGSDGKVVQQIEKVIPAHEAKGIDPIIGFHITDAFGCEYGWGVFFGKSKLVAPPEPDYTTPPYSEH